jgi:periplasmic copper chaperone A
MKQSSLSVEAREHVTLQPGGYHLMLMNPERIFKADDKVALQLHFSNGEVLHLTVPVRNQYVYDDGGLARRCMQ